MITITIIIKAIEVISMESIAVTTVTHFTTHYNYPKPDYLGFAKLKEATIAKSLVTIIFTTIIIIIVVVAAAAAVAVINGINFALFTSNYFSGVIVLAFKKRYFTITAFIQGKLIILNIGKKTKFDLSGFTNYFIGFANLLFDYQIQFTIAILGIFFFIAATTILTTNIIKAN